MMPVKLNHEHDEIQRLKPVKLIDLRDYGLAHAAPKVDGSPLLVFRPRRDGTLIPAA